MSGVYIPNWKIPDTCDECDFLFDDVGADTDACDIEKRPVKWRWKDKHSTDIVHDRPEWCPLIEIPDGYAKVVVVK